MENKRNNPIGVFDSGLGGLTVVRAIRRLLPAEDIIYFGDSARLPYGTKSKRQIIEFSLDNARFLIKKNIKALVIACNSSSANAYYVLKKRLSIPVIDVITPASQAACEVTQIGKVGVIGTHATIESKAYQNEIQRTDGSVKVYTQKCSLFVPLVEEGWLHNGITKKIINHYIVNLKKKGIDALILGCTHYPLLKKAIADEVGKKISIIDSGPYAARLLRRKLIENRLCRNQKHTGKLRIFVSDLSPRFMTIGERFLNQKIDHCRVVRW